MAWWREGEEFESRNIKDKMEGGKFSGRKTS